MNRKRSVFLLLITAVMILTAMPIAVSANAPGPNMDGLYERNPLLVFILIVVSVLGVLFTCAVEYFVAQPFGLRIKYGRVIILTNVATQVTMRLLQLLIPQTVPEEMALLVWYAICVLVLELLVFLVEFFAYCAMMRQVSKKRVCLYTLVANASSALGGLLLLAILL